MAEAEAEREPGGNAAEPSQDGNKKRRRAEGKQGTGMPKFRRGLPVATRRLADKKLKGRLRHTEALAEEAAASAAKAHQWLLPDAAGSLEAEGMERTWRFAQSDIVQEVEEGAGRKVFDLSLPQLGPYKLDFTRSGRLVVLGGRKGHLAMLDWHQLHTICELQVKETVRDVRFLHNELFFAAAQRKYVYIYDKRGIEVHCLKDHTEPKRLEFLPYHFLLASVGEPGVLTYQDTSTGQLVAQHKTRLGPCGVMAQNPWNAVLQLGHANGTVTCWTPNLSTPAVRLLAHRGPVSAIAVEPGGNQMVTAGVDGQVRVWDVRKLAPLHTYFSRAPATELDISQRGLLAVGSNRRVQVWKDAVLQKAASPYLVHELPQAPLAGLVFRPYEDTLLAGHGGGVTSVLVPGAGEPHFDSRVADPFQAKKARQEMEVAQLLDKLQPAMITLDAATIGQVRKEPKEVQKQRQLEAAAANAAQRAKQRESADKKTRMKGKNRPTRRAARKKDNIIEEKKAGAKQRLAEEQQQRQLEQRQKAEAAEPPEGVPRALHTFYRKACSAANSHEPG